jgi:hypothetical protein
MRQNRANPNLILRLLSLLPGRPTKPVKVDYLPMLIIKMMQLEERGDTTFVDEEMKQHVKDNIKEFFPGSSHIL